MYRVYIRRNVDCNCECCRLVCHKRCECCRYQCLHADDQTCVCVCYQFITCDHECRLSRPAIYIDVDIPESRESMIRFVNDSPSGSSSRFFMEHIVAKVSFDIFRIVLLSYTTEKEYRISDGSSISFGINNELELAEVGEFTDDNTVEILSIIKM